MITFNKKGYSINLQLSKQAQEIAYNSYIWNNLCKLCKPIALNLSNYEYFKFRWLGNTVVFWRINDKIYKELY